MLNDPVVLILMYFILPLWLAAGFADWLCHRASHVPKRGDLVEEKGGNHEGDDAGVYLEEDGSKQRQAHFCKHDEMENRLLRPAGRFDVRGAVAQPIGKSRQ